jgi:hypothetical protein
LIELISRRRTAGYAVLESSAEQLFASVIAYAPLRVIPVNREDIGSSAARHSDAAGVEYIAVDATGADKVSAAEFSIVENR